MVRKTVKKKSRLMKVSRDVPISEIVLRKYPKPYKLSEREGVKRLCLSLGLLSPGESRDVIVDVFFVILRSSKNGGEGGNSGGSNGDLDLLGIVKEVKKLRKEYKLPLVGVAASNITRQVRRLKELLLVEKKGGVYRLAEGLSLKELFSEKLKGFYLSTILERVEEYVDLVDDTFFGGDGGVGGAGFDDGKGEK